MYAIERETGQLRWHNELAGGGSKSGYLDCFAPDGTRKWSQPLRGAGTGRAALGYPGNVVQADDIGNQ